MIKFPLFEGFGTHYVYLYVGHPIKQRVSVIVDTGSHHTAFPCKGCNCGKHMNPFYNPKLSNSSNIASCRGNLNRCRFSQSYSEGSSWTAYKVQDMIHMGGLTEKSITHSDTLSIPFDFGCQEQETGLFRTQHEDGIMGFSAREDTFPFQLKRKRVIKSNVFSMCFRPRGGYLTLPSAVSSSTTASQQSTTTTSINHSLSSSNNNNNNHHNNINIPMTYIPLVKSVGWYTVRLVDILMYVPSTPSQSSSTHLALSATSSSSMKLAVSKPLKSTYAAYEMNRRSTSSVNSNNNLRGNNDVVQKVSIGASESVYNGGKGTIIDSGTTDTYLPTAIKSQFEKLFLKLSQGVTYTNNRIALTDSQFNLLPVIVYRFHNKFNPLEFVDIETYPSSYAQKMKTRKFDSSNNTNNIMGHQQQHEYTFRIYLTESVGTVLGSNFMNYHNIEFNIDDMQVGIQPDSCHFEKPKRSRTRRGLLSSSSNYNNTSDNIDSYSNSDSKMVGNYDSQDYEHYFDSDDDYDDSDNNNDESASDTLITGEAYDDAVDTYRQYSRYNNNRRKLLHIENNIDISQYFGSYSISNDYFYIPTNSVVYYQYNKTYDHSYNINSSSYISVNSTSCHLVIAGTYLNNNITLVWLLLFCILLIIFASKTRS